MSSLFLSNTFENQSDEHWRDVIATFVKERLELHCEQQEFTRDHLQVFTVDDACEADTQSEPKWSQNSIDHESSDAVKLKQRRDPMV